jgi:hypothetical protein
VISDGERHYLQVALTELQIRQSLADRITLSRLNNILMCWQYYSAQLGLVNMYRVSDEPFARRALIFVEKSYPEKDFP